jgi:ComF family protein
VVLDALLPPHCLTCDAAVTLQGTLCPACFRGLSFITAPLCRHCGVPFAHEGEGEDGLCPRCAGRASPLLAVRAALRYDEAAKRLILPLKHADRTELARPLARHMARAGAELLAGCDLVVPVPSHWRRRIARRYCQATLLAREVSRLGRPRYAPDLLARARATPPLGERGAADRAALLEGVFALRRGAAARLAGRRVLLVDDVVTSGATGEACAQVLLAGGAASVDMLAAARVPDPRLRTRSAEAESPKR